MFKKINLQLANRLKVAQYERLDKKNRLLLKD